MEIDAVYTFFSITTEKVRLSSILMVINALTA